MEYQLTESPNVLPSDIIINILSRLAVKSLCRFKCVSKPWRSLISDHDFVKVHFNKAFEYKDVMHQRRRLVFTGVENRSLYFSYLDEFVNRDVYLNNRVNNVGDNGLVTATELAFVYSIERDILVSLICYCNGLLLCQLHESKELHLVNPATRELKILPRTPKPYRYSSLCGFGYDHSTDEHKVVCGRININHGIEFCVYTLETDSWRVIRDNFNCFECTKVRGIHLNGELHWLMHKGEYEAESSVIVSLVLAKEEVREIQLSPEYSIENSPPIELGLFREWLCISHNVDADHDQTYNEFWVMKEHGVKESWTKMRVSIPYHKLSHSGFWTKTHDLMVIGERLLMYNFDDDENFMDLPIRGVDKVGSILIYLDSLVSLSRNQSKGSSKKTSVSTYNAFITICFPSCIFLSTWIN